MKTSYEIFMSVFIAFCLIALTIIACMCYEIRHSQNKLLDENTTFFAWYINNFEPQYYEENNGTQEVK